MSNTISQDPQLISVFRLMRLDKPVGILLLWWPTLWALCIANHGLAPWSLVWWFGLGTLLMRSAGCVLNDIADRRIDLHVQRTKNRPLTSGALSLLQAWGVLFILLALAFVVLVQLPKLCFYYGLISLGLAWIYPFCKRFLSSPQSVLSLAFSMGIPMVYAASGYDPDLNMWVLLGLNILWVLAYDTLYACVDKTDDQRIGVNSTALYWGEHTTRVIVTLQVMVQGAWLILMMNLHLNWVFGVAWLMGSYSFWRQYQLLKQATPEACFEAFKLNAWYGGWMAAGILGSYMITH
jgi:4-hydroxybenzoate polyprenyltransferase